MGILDLIYNEGTVTERNDLKKGVMIEARIPRRLKDRIERIIAET